MIRLGFNFDPLSQMKRCYLAMVYFLGCKHNLRTSHYCLLTISLTEMVISKEHTRPVKLFLYKWTRISSFYFLAYFHSDTCLRRMSDTNSFVHFQNNIISAMPWSVSEVFWNIWFQLLNIFQNLHSNRCINVLQNQMSNQIDV